MLLVVLRFHCPFIAVPFIPVASEHRMELCMQSVALESKQFEALKNTVAIIFTYLQILELLAQ